MGATTKTGHEGHEGRGRRAAAEGCGFEKTRRGGEGWSGSG